MTALWSLPPCPWEWGLFWVWLWSRAVRMDGEKSPSCRTQGAQATRWMLVFPVLHHLILARASLAAPVRQHWFL